MEVLVALNTVQRKQVEIMSDIEFAIENKTTPVRAKGLRQQSGVAPSECHIDFSQIIDEGYKAKRQGLTSKRCPYSDLVSRSYWLAGFNDADM